MARQAWVRRLLRQSLPLVVGLLPFGLFGPAFAQRVIHVRQDAQGLNDGSSWGDAYRDLQDALEDARGVGGCPCEIWIAAGVYKPDRGTGDRRATFNLVSGVALYGGFAGHESCHYERNWAASVTVLSGDLSDNDGPFDCPDTSDCCREHEGVGCDDAACEEIVCRVDEACCDANVLSGWWWPCVRVALESCCHLGSWGTCENSHVVARAIDCGPGTKLDGLTVAGAYYNRQGEGGEYFGYTGGMGVYATASELTIDNCVFQNSYDKGLYGEVDSRLFVEDSFFGDHHRGAGVAAEFSEVTVERCSFIEGARLSVDAPPYWDGVARHSTVRNTAFGRVASAAIQGDATVDSCTFHEGSVGLVLSDGRSSVTNCRFHKNIGPLRVIDGAGVIDNCVFRGGTSSAAAGVSGSALFRNCVFIGNEATAIRAGFADLHVLNCVVVGNGTRLRATDPAGGGIYLQDYASAQVLDSIIWGNQTANPLREPGQLAVGHTSALEIDYSIIDGWSGVFGGDGNSGDDPLFADLDGRDDILGTEDDDARLSPGSPAINAGLSTSPYLLPTDLDGHARILCGQVDIGAYEFGLGDFDCNQAMNLTDFAAWYTCMTGPQGGPFDAGCEAFDADADGDADLRDFAGFSMKLAAP